MSSSNLDSATVLVYHAVALRDVSYHSVAALVLLVWHAIVTFDEEVEYIWAMRNKNPIKWTYMYLRYFVIAAHIVHNCLTEQLTNGPMFCDVWRAYIICLAQSLATSVEFLLALRVFALYNRSRKIAFLLLVLILAEIGGAARMLWMQDNIKFYGTCLLSQLTHSSRIQTIFGFMIHCTLIGLTLFKYVVAFRAGWGRTPLVSLVIRDGSTVYATTFFMLISVLVIFDLEKERGIAIFYWGTAVLSIMGCYLVVSMERLAREDVWTGSSGPFFTSELELE